MPRHIRKIVVFSLVFIYSVEIASGVVFTGCHLLDIFMHGNVFHLFLCCYCLWEMLHDWPLKNLHMLAVGVGAAALAAYLSPTPFQGTSGIVFALTGLRLSAYPTRRNCVAVLSAFVVCTVAQPLSWCVHGVPLLLGFIYYRIYAKKQAYGKRHREA